MVTFKQMFSVKRMFGVVCLVVVPNMLCGANVMTIEGQLRNWHPITIQFQGLAAHELDSDPNPFMDYRLNVEFINPSGQSIIVPGFFNGDGQGGASGSTWTVRFTPDMTGQWKYVASFREGKNIAVNLQRDVGQAVGFDGVSGTLTISESTAYAPEFLRLGRLEYSGEYYLKFRESLEGGSKVKIGPAPSTPDEDWVVLVSKRKRS